MLNLVCLENESHNRWKTILQLAAVSLTLALITFAPAALLGQTYTDLHDFTVAEGDGSPNPSMPQVLAQGRDGNLYGTQPHGGANLVGTVFRMTPTGTITVIYNFAISDGAYPESGLTLGTDGNFYGTTYSGGKNNYGTVFKITPSGTLTTLYHFDGLANRFYPFAGVVQGKNGAFYGITLYGAVYSVTSSGKFKALNNGVGGSPYAPLTLANDGNFYGTTFNGGASGFGNVFRVSAAGAFKNLYSFDLTHGYHPLGLLVQGPDGQLYGTTAGYGLHNGGVAFKITLKGTLTVLHDFDPAVPGEGSVPQAGLIAASDGKIYGVTSAGGTSKNGTVFQVTKAGSFTTLYSLDATHGSTPAQTPMQHTNGIIYGLAYGGANGKGVFYSFNNSLPRFVALMTTGGTAGQTVQILGTGLTGTTAVNFGSGPAAFNVASDSYMTATVPADGTSGYVTVVTPSGTLTSNKQYKITPVLSGFSPSSGPVGSLVVITGSGFVGATQVTFGGVKATAFTVNSGSQITATVPVGAKSGKIVVKTPGGNASSKTGFTVI